MQLCLFLVRIIPLSCMSWINSAVQAELSCDDVSHWPKVFTVSQSPLAVVRLWGSRAPIRGRAADGGQSGAPLLFDGLLSLATGAQLTTETLSVIRQRSNIWRQKGGRGESLQKKQKTKTLVTQTQNYCCAWSFFGRHIWSPRGAPGVPGPCCCSPVEAHPVRQANPVPQANPSRDPPQGLQRLRTSLLRV